MSAAPDLIEIYTDGACTGNPGPAGCGAVLLHKGRVKELSTYLGEATNNIAELTAVELALQALRTKHLPVRIHADSTYVIGVLSGTLKVRANAVLVARIRALMDSFADVSFAKVRGHAGVAHNVRADALARHAIRAAGNAAARAPAAPAIKAVIFDLDGVIVSTDEFHFQAWKQLADAEGIPFTRHDNERLRGVSRMESLEIMLEKATRTYSAEEKHAMAERKNSIYRASLSQLSPADILPGVTDFLAGLRQRGIKIAIGSSSKNAGPILKAIGLHHTFDAVVDGTHIRRSKPDPEVFTLAGVRLGVPPEQCLVVEDAAAGVDAGLAAGMRVLAVGSAATHPRATLRAADLTKITVAECLPMA